MSWRGALGGAVVGGLAGLAMAPLLGVLAPFGGAVVGGAVGASLRGQIRDMGAATGPTGSSRVAEGRGRRIAGLGGAVVGLGAGVALGGLPGAMLGLVLGGIAGSWLGTVAGSAAWLAAAGGPATAIGAGLGVLSGLVRGFRLGAGFSLATRPLQAGLPPGVVNPNPALEGLIGALAMAGLFGFLGAGLGLVVDQVLRGARRR